MLRPVWHVNHNEKVGKWVLLEFGYEFATNFFVANQWFSCSVKKTLSKHVPAFHKNKKERET